jgi:hypothetical protein
LKAVDDLVLKGKLDPDLVKAVVTYEEATAAVTVRFP